MNVDTSEFRALSAEVAGLRADVAQLLRLGRIFYDAGHDDALGRAPAAAAPRAGKPRRPRSRHLKVVQL